MTAVEEYELYAIRYATRDARRADHFIGGDPHDAAMPMDYYVWLARNAERSVLVDIGCSREVAERRGRTYLCSPDDVLHDMSVDPKSLSDVVITHLHYDHVGNLSRFPAAKFHVQERELAFATGPAMRHPFISQAFEAEDVADLVKLNFRSRVQFHDGDTECFPGISLHLAGGHSHGLQFVCVRTKRGKVVLASDVAHFYENITSARPFHIAYHVGEMLDGFEKLLAVGGRDLAAIIPGHDPLVTELYPSISGKLQGRVFRLDVSPSKAPEAAVVRLGGSTVLGCLHEDEKGCFHA